MASQLKDEFQYYLDHQEELVKQYDGKFIVIKGGAVIGDYEDELEAIEKTREDHELGTFLVQKCEPGEGSYTQTFHTNVIFYDHIGQ